VTFVERVRYAPKGDLGTELQGAVRAALDGGTGVGDRRLWLRAATKATWFYGTYAVLVLVSLPWWAAGLGATCLGLAASAAAPTVHDAVHRQLSSRRWVNLAVAYAVLPNGISRAWWAVKHNGQHHGYTNVAGSDDDLDFGPVARFSPAQPWRPWHRWQHVYLWALYPFLFFAMAAGDLPFVLFGRVGGKQLVRPTVRRAGALLAEKLAGVAVVTGIALLLRPAAAVAAAFLVAAAVHGFVSAVCFQVEHVVEGTAFPEPGADGRIRDEWFRCQLVGAADVNPGNRLLTWFLGGLNLHVEHHLFPRVAAVRLPELVPVVRGVAREHGITCVELRTMRAAIASHQRRLLALGAPDGQPSAIAPVSTARISARRDAQPVLAYSRER